MNEVLKDVVKEIDFHKGDNVFGMLSLVKEASDRKVKFSITTEMDMNEFEDCVGKACVEKMEMTPLISNLILNAEDDRVFAFIGRLIMDAYANQKYVIITKAGLVDGNKIYEIDASNSMDIDGGVI